MMILFHNFTGRCYMKNLKKYYHHHKLRVALNVTLVFSILLYMVWCPTFPVFSIFVCFILLLDFLGFFFHHKNVVSSCIDWHYRHFMTRRVSFKPKSTAKNKNEKESKVNGISQEISESAKNCSMRHIKVRKETQRDWYIILSVFHCLFSTPR